LSERERGVFDDIIDEFDRLTEEAYDEGTIPEDETAGDWMIEQMEIAESTILSEQDDEDDVQEASEENDHSEVEYYNSESEFGYSGYSEYSDWSDGGGVYQDAGEAYDNFDWNALD
jgi:hypothetical protein